MPFVFLAALVSGFSVFLNKFATTAVPNAFILTGTRNTLVALLLTVVVFFPAVRNKFTNLTRADWLKLTALGLIGGSVPFILFFHGLTLTSAVNAAFIHKTLFIWVGLLAAFFLKEKFSRPQYLALAVLITGNLILTKLNSWHFQTADLFILGATLLWAAEFILAKKILTNLDAKIVAWARMFLGAIILLIFLALRGQLAAPFTLNIAQYSWIGLTGVLLFIFVLSWYSGLQKLPATTAASVLVLASPLTTLLNAIFVTKQLNGAQIIGALLIFAAVAILFASNKKVFSHASDEQTI